MRYLPAIADGKTRFGGQSHAPGLLSLYFTFINMLVIGDQAWLSMQPASLIKLLLLFLFMCISVASFTSQSSCPDVLSNIETPVKLMQ